MSAPAARAFPDPPDWVPRPHAHGNREYERWMLHVRVADGDRTSLARLVESYRGYAIALARRFARQGEPLEDLIQVASEALIVSLRRYQPDREVPFMAFATPTITGALRRHHHQVSCLACLQSVCLQLQSVCLQWPAF